jgi:molybdopterin molybdotransferase
MKPGKPVLFGVKAGPHPQPLSQGARGDRLVFGLPGNPVASLVCFELFVRPAIRTMMALPAGGNWVKATMASDYAFRTDRPTYHPARLQWADAGWTVEAAAWFGSPDLRGAQPANAFMLLPEGDHLHRMGQMMDVLRVEDFN